MAILKMPFSHNTETQMTSMVDLKALSLEIPFDPVLRQMERLPMFFIHPDEDRFI